MCTPLLFARRGIFISQERGSEKMLKSLNFRKFCKIHSGNEKSLK